MRRLTHVAGGRARAIKGAYCRPFVSRRRRMEGPSPNRADSGQSESAVWQGDPLAHEGMARNKPPHGRVVSIVSLLILYWSSIVPLLAGAFFRTPVAGEREGAGGPTAARPHPVHLLLDAPRHGLVSSKRSI